MPPLLGQWCAPVRRGGKKRALIGFEADQSWEGSSCLSISGQTVAESPHAMNRMVRDNGCALLRKLFRSVWIKGPGVSHLMIRKYFICNTLETFLKHFLFTDVSDGTPMNIQICAITFQGEFCSQSAPDLAAARLVGASHVQEGTWRAWDAFDISGGRSSGHRLLASYPSSADSHDAQQELVKHG